MGKTRSKFITFIVVFSMLMSMGVSFGENLSNDGLQLEGGEFTEGLVTSTDSGIQVDVEEPINYVVKYFVDETEMWEVSGEVSIEYPIVDKVDDRTPEGYMIDEEKSTPLPFDVSEDGQSINIYYIPTQMLDIMPMAIAEDYNATSDVFRLNMDSTNDFSLAIFAWFNDNDLFLAIGSQHNKTIQDLTYQGKTITNLVIDRAENENDELIIEGDKYGTANSYYPKGNEKVVWNIVNLGQQKLPSKFTLGITFVGGGHDVEGAEVLVESDLQVFHKYDGGDPVLDIDQSGDLNINLGYKVEPVYEGYEEFELDVITISHNGSNQSEGVLDPDGYLIGTVSPINNEASAVITFYYTSIITIPVEKVWEGQVGQPVIITLYADGTIEETLELNSANDWTEEFTELAKYKHGERISYTVDELDVPNDYTKEITGTMEKGFTVTNTSENVTVEYITDGNGTIVGKEIQLIVRGSDTEPVTAVPNDGYYFVKWDDDNTNPTRHEENVITDATYKAIFAANQKLTVTAASDSKEYDGTALTKGGKDGWSLTSGNLLGEDELVVTVEGSITDAGTEPNQITEVRVMNGEDDVTENYEIEEVDGELKVTKKAVTITAKSEEFSYDGSVHTNPDYTVDGLVGVDKIEATVAGKITYPNESPVANKVTSHSFTAGNADNYNVTYVDGELTMLAVNIEIEVTANSYSKDYDGKSLTKDGWSLTSGSLLGGDELVVTVEGSITDAGTEPNQITEVKVMNGEEDVTTNYTITEVEGELEVIPLELTIRANNKFKIFDESDPEFTATIEGFIEGESTEDLSGELKFTREEGEAVGIYDITPSGVSSNNYNITFEKGQLTIMSADSIVLEVSGFEGVYDGKYHGVSVTNESDFESVEYSTDKDTWSVSLPEFRDVGIYTVYVKATNDNFDDSYASADVVITPRPITITASSSSRTFNGQPLTNGNYSITSGSIAENDELLDVTVTGTQTSVGSSANVPSDAIIRAFEEVDAIENYEITYVDGTLTVTSSGSSGGGGTTTTSDDDEEIDEPLPLAPIQPDPEIEIPVVVEEEPVILPDEPEMVEIEKEPTPLAAPTLPKTGSVGAGEMAGFGALLMAIGILLGKKKEF